MVRSMVPWSARFPRPLTSLRRDLSRMMEAFGLDEEWTPFMEEFTPRTNVAETEEAVEVTVELPGMKPEEFNVEVRKGELWISGEKKEETEEKGKTYHRVERHYGEFHRVIPLPSSVEEEKIQAEYREGVLKVSIPKSEEAKPKHIEVKA